MPWKVVSRDGKFCVVKSDDGKTVKCHPTKAKAERHKRALYANVHSSLAMEPYLDDDGTWHIDNVPLVETGMDYPAATGPVTFTEQQLSDAVEAIQDSAIQDPKVKLGHASAYNEMLVGDAEQAFGRIENLRISDNGQVVYGDYVGLPEWLAMVMPVAYPNRSVEASFDVKTVTGKQHSMVITSVSNLGVRWPGCSVLQDLPVWYGPEIPDGVEIDDAVAAGGDMGKVIAAVDTAQVRRKFYKEYATAGNGRGAWWVRAERYSKSDGLHLIVDDEESGEIWKVAVKVKNNDDIEFGEPVLVTVEYPEKAAAARAAVVAGMAAEARERGEQVVTYASRADSSPEESTTQEGATMDEKTRLALVAKLGLPEDASEEQIDKRLRDNALAADETSGQQGSADTAPAADEHGTTGPSPETPAPGAETGSGPNVAVPPDPTEEEGKDKDKDDAEASIVKIDKGTYDRLIRGATLAETHEQQSRSQRIEATLDEAMAVGKFPPASRKAWKGHLERDFDGAKASLDALQPGLIPLEARGGAGNTADGSTLAGDTGGLPAEWFPELAQMKKQQTGPVIHAKEA